MILSGKDYAAPSVFQPENLLREARRQKAIPPGSVPAVGVLDPDGDILAYLQAHHRAAIHPHWACYHTRLYQASYQGVDFGIIGCGVEASFAVLLAEQLFASGCQLLISITSAGVIQPPPRIPGSSSLKGHCGTRAPATTIYRPINRPGSRPHCSRPCFPLLMIPSRR